MIFIASLLGLPTSKTGDGDGDGVFYSTVTSSVLKISDDLEVGAYDVFFSENSFLIKYCKSCWLTLHEMSISP